MHLTKNLIYKINIIKKSKSNKFIAGQSRYCQKCGIETTELFEVTQNVQKTHQLQYCAKCKGNYTIKKK